MKKALLTIGVFSIVLTGIYSPVLAASSRLIWVSYDEDWNVDQELIIEDGETYQVPFGVERFVFAESDLSSFGAEGYLYFIDDATSAREFVAQIGGSGGVEVLAWEREGTYEIDVYYASNAPAKNNLLRWLANLFVHTAHAQTTDLIETISFTIEEGEGADLLTPVLIIPGIMGSYLNREEDGTEVWMNLLKMVLPGEDSYLNDMALLNTGDQIVPLVPVDVVREVNVPLFTRDLFSGLIGTFLDNGYTENDNLFVFPYDWRLDIEENALKLDERIELIKNQTNSNSVDIVAHSMGGLLLKSYIDEFGGMSVGKFIDVATPHMGSPESFVILNYGDVGISILNQSKIKDISQNMPSVYQLLPNMAYGTYLFDMDDLDDNGVSGPLNCAETGEFMKNTGRNSLLVDRAEDFHQDIDNIDPTDYGVETHNFIGCGTPTLDKIFILDEEVSGGVEYNISYINGDGTVAVKSAGAMNSDAVYYLEDATHALMPSATGVKDLIVSILKDEDIDPSLYPNIRSSIDECSISDGRIVSFHSPIDLHIYDQDGKHVGPNANGDIEYNIPGVQYDMIDGNKFAFLPNGEEYTIKGASTGSGTFNVRIEEIVSEVVTNTKYFTSVPLTNLTLVEVIGEVVLLDSNGDGQMDDIVVSDDADVYDLLGILKDKINTLDVKEKLKKNLLKKMDNLEKKIQKKKAKDKSLYEVKQKIANIIKNILKKEQKGKLSETDSQGIIDLLEQIESKL